MSGLRRSPTPRQPDAPAKGCAGSERCETQPGHGDESSSCNQTGCFGIGCRGGSRPSGQGLRPVSGSCPAHAHPARSTGLGFKSCLCKDAASQTTLVRYGFSEAACCTRISRQQTISRVCCCQTTDSAHASAKPTCQTYAATCAAVYSEYAGVVERSDSIAAGRCCNCDYTYAEIHRACGRRSAAYPFDSGHPGRAGCRVCVGVGWIIVSHRPVHQPEPHLHHTDVASRCHSKNCGGVFRVYARRFDNG